MKYLWSISAVIIAMGGGSAACAAPASGIMIEQMNPDSVMMRRDVEETATAATPAATGATIGDDLKDVLRDHKISQLGRANDAISSQYGGQPLVKPAPLNLEEEKPILLQPKKKPAKSKKTPAATH